MLDKGYAFLKKHQGEDGSFSPQVAGPGVTALVVAALLRNGYAADDPVVAKGLAYLEKNVQKDGGIYDKGLANYTTSVALMAFQEANKDGKYDAILKNGDEVPQGLAGRRRPTPRTRKSGGVGYDGKGRPDLSNTQYLHRRADRGRRAQGRPGHPAGAEVRQPLPEPARRDQRPAVRREGDRGRQGRLRLHAGPRRQEAPRRPTAACVRWAP